MNIIRSLKSLTVMCFMYLSLQFSLAEKRALIVAVGKYPETSGWAKINSENDVPIIRTALINQGFSSGNINVLINQQATKAGIIKALNNLIAISQPGDIVVFHFSGHGQQVTDTKGDEINGLDEALIPYDANIKPSAVEPDARFHLIDDEVGVFLDKLRKKVGLKGDVLFFIDACHCGPMSRDMADTTVVVRGTSQIFETRGFSSKSVHKIKNNFYNISSKTAQQNLNFSPYTIISACLSNQTNIEYKKCGSLSYAIGKVLSKSMGNLSYESFFNAIRTEMLPLMVNSMGITHEQNPQIEGDIGRKVFAGKTVDIPLHFIVNNIKLKKVYINAGTINGIFKGAEVSFYPPETYDISKCKPYITCKVDTSSLSESVLTISSDIDKKRLFSSWIFVTKYRYITYIHESVAQMRARILKTLPQNSNDIIIKMIPVNNGKIIDLSQKYRNGNIYLNLGDKFIIEVDNKSKSALYFQLIDVMKNNQISLIMENNINSKYNYFLEPGQSKVFDKDILKVDSDSPPGEETIVIVASEKMLDLSPIETQKPVMKRADISEFEEWLNNLYSNDRSISVFDSKKVYTNKLSFMVREK